MGYSFNDVNTFPQITLSCGGLNDSSSTSSPFAGMPSYMPYSGSYGVFSNPVASFTPMLFMPRMDFLRMPLFDFPTRFNARTYCQTKPTKMKLSEESHRKIEEMSKRVGFDPNDFGNLMLSECGGNVNAVNPKGGAVGAIQFTEAARKDLGISSDALKRMPLEEQLPYIEKYLVNAKKNAGISQDAKIDSGTLYSLVFLPAYAKNEVLCTQGSKYYDANKGLDQNHDGFITKTDLANRLSKYS